MANSRVTHAENAGVHILRYHGRVDYTMAPTIRRFGESLTHQAVCTLVFDLSDAECLDSTNLGLLAQLAERMRNACGTHCVIISTQTEITSVLVSMGFDQSFKLVTHLSATASPHEDELLATPASRRELGITVLEAHRALVALSETGGLQFREVVACLESELGTLATPYDTAPQT